MVKRLCIVRRGGDFYDMEEDINGAYVDYDDYKDLEEKYRSLVKRYAALTQTDVFKTKFMNNFFDIHD